MMTTLKIEIKNILNRLKRSIVKYQYLTLKVVVINITNSRPLFYSILSPL